MPEVQLKLIESEAEQVQFARLLKDLIESNRDSDPIIRNRRDLISMLIADYEKRRIAETCIDPVDAIRQRMKEFGLRQKDLARLLGGTNRASEVLARRRPLTLPMIRSLHRDLRIPAELLIREIALRTKSGDSVQPNSGSGPNLDTP